jgi:hypothetical protein
MNITGSKKFDCELLKYNSYRSYVHKLVLMQTKFTDTIKATMRVIYKKSKHKVQRITHWPYVSSIGSSLGWILITVGEL